MKGPECQTENPRENKSCRKCGIEFLLGCFEAAQLRGFTAFVGREQELGTLRCCLDKAEAGNGQFVTVVGEARVWKSRLLYEFRLGRYFCVPAFIGERRREWHVGIHG